MTFLPKVFLGFAQFSDFILPFKFKASNVQQYIQIESYIMLHYIDHTSLCIDIICFNLIEEREIQHKNVADWPPYIYNF